MRLPRWIALIGFICVSVSLPLSSLALSPQGKTPTPADAPVTKRVVCIDPGHGLKTIGAEGKHLKEYLICWKMALRLKAELQRQGITVVLTKTSAEENVESKARAEVANAAHADLFLRLHCDAVPDTGIATFYPDRKGTKDGVRGPDQKIISSSHRAARAFHAALLASLAGALRDRGIRTDNQTQVGRQLGGALTGSIYSHVPVLLIEMCVLTNRKDEAFLASEAGQQKLTRALAAGVVASIKQP